MNEKLNLKYAKDYIPKIHNLTLKSNVSYDEQQMKKPFQESAAAWHQKEFKTIGDRDAKIDLKYNLNIELAQLTINGNFIEQRMVKTPSIGSFKNPKINENNAKCNATKVKEKINGVESTDASSTSLAPTESYSCINNPKLCLSFLDRHLVNVLYPKVCSYVNGISAADLSIWYERTFDKELQNNWLTIMEKSQQFRIENVSDKTMLYTLNNAKYNSKIAVPKGSKGNNVNAKKDSKPIPNFVRFKHLNKSWNMLDQKIL